LDTGRLESLWGRLIGPAAEARVFGELTWADLLVTASYLALALLGTLVAAWAVRRCASASGEATPLRESLSHMARALGKPLHVLI